MARFAVLCCFTALALSACATASTKATVSDGRLVAWGALDTMAVTLDGAAKSGLLKGAEAATAAHDLTVASADLQAADTAAAALDTGRVAADVASATALIVALEAIAANAK